MSVVSSGVMHHKLVLLTFLADLVEVYAMLSTLFSLLLIHVSLPIELQEFVEALF